MRLDKLMHGLAMLPSGAETVEISRICIDSRKAAPGALFIAMKGAAGDGHDFIAQAVAQGASAVLCQEMRDVIAVPMIVVDDSRLVMAQVAARFHGNPADALRLYGVTGTNGKTTVATLLESVYKAAGVRTGLLGTLGYRWSERSLEGMRTTPDAPELHELFRLMADDDVKSVFMEVSSHATVLHRTSGLAFEAAIFTNFTRDHMDFHPDESHYLNAKLQLFRQIKSSGLAIINGNDAQAGSFREAAGGSVLQYGFGSGFDASVVSYEFGPSGSHFRLAFNGSEYDFTLPLWGQFNIANGAAAALTALADGVDHQDVQRGFQALERVPGRMEGSVTAQGSKVVIDYAHTPDALENVLNAVREMTPGRLWVVFGCGGDRDKGKRPVMGEIAGDLADEIIITDDNPRTEDPASILEQIQAGCRAGARCRVIGDRRTAIETALAEAGAEDSVLVAGKGHETYQEINGQRHHFDDMEVVRNWIEDHS